MKKLLFFLFTLCSLTCFAQSWKLNKLDVNPLTGVTINEFTYSDINYNVKISPVFNNVVLIDTQTPIGKIKVNRFNHAVTSKVTVKYYDLENNKVGRSIEKIYLGTIFANKKRNVGSIHTNKLYDYINNETGYVVIWYSSLFDGQDISIVIPCINNES